MNRRASFVLAVTALGGCAVSTAFSPTNAPPHALSARAPASVEVHTLAPTDRPFVDIGLFEAYIDTVADNRDKVMKRLREDAGKRGCDAIITTAGSAVTPVLGPSVDTVYHATCIVYR